MEPRAVPHLSSATVAELLDPPALVDISERVFRELGDRSAATTVRVRARTEGAMASAMAAAVPSLGYTGGKLYSTVDGRFEFLVALFDLTGRLVCTMDGAPLTEARTPALSAVAIDRFAAEGASVATVLGTGREALPHLRMLSERPGIGEIRLWGRRAAAATEVAEAAHAMGIDVNVVGNADDAVNGADVVVTVTSANEPIVSADAFNERVLVCAVGATKPERCELPVELVGRAAAVITDSTDGAPAEAGDLIHAAAAGHFDWANLIDISDVLSGQVLVPRAGDIGPVVFETQGVAIQDVAAAAQVYDAYRATTN